MSPSIWYMENQLIISYLQNELAIDPSVHFSLDELTGKMEAYISGLIQNDFQKLVHMLYKIDVSENKLRKVLSENPGEDAAKMIVGLIIERQEQKIRTRKNFQAKEKGSSGKKDENEDEW